MEKDDAHEVLLKTQARKTNGYFWILCCLSIIRSEDNREPTLVHAIVCYILTVFCELWGCKFIRLLSLIIIIIIIAGWMSPLIARGQLSRGTLFCNKILITLGFWSGIKVADASQEWLSHAIETRALESVINGAVNTLYSMLMLIWTHLHCTLACISAAHGKLTFLSGSLCFRWRRSSATTNPSRRK